MKITISAAAAILAAVLLTGWNFFIAGVAVSLPEDVILNGTENSISDAGMITEKVKELKQAASFASRDTVNSDNWTTFSPQENPVPGTESGNSYAKTWDSGSLTLNGRQLSFPLSSRQNESLQAEFDELKSLDCRLIYGADKIIGVEISKTDDFSRDDYQEMPLQLPGGITIGSNRGYVQKVYGQSTDSGALESSTTGRQSKEDERKNLEYYWSENIAGNTYVCLVLAYEDDKVCSIYYTGEPVEDVYVQR